MKVKLAIIAAPCHQREIFDHLRRAQLEAGIIRDKGGRQRIHVYEMCPRHAVFLAEVGRKPEDSPHFIRVLRCMDHGFEVFGQHVEGAIVAEGLPLKSADVRELDERIRKGILDRGTYALG